MNEKTYYKNNEDDVIDLSIPKSLLPLIAKLVELDNDFISLKNMLSRLSKEERKNFYDFVDRNKESLQLSKDYTAFGKEQIEEKSKVPFGFKSVNHRPVIDEQKAKDVNKIFCDYEKYSEHPPKELVLAVIEESSIRGEAISYDDAEKQVSKDDIMIYIANDINKKHSVKSNDQQRDR